MPMTKEEKAAYNKAYYQKVKEKKKEAMKEAGKKKLAEETPEQRAARLEKMRVYNAAVTAKRRAAKAEEKAKKAEAEPPKPKPEPKPKARGGFLKKKEGETEEQIAARVAYNKAHFKKVQAKKAKKVASAEDRAKKEAEGFVYQKEGETPEEVKARQEAVKVYYAKKKAEKEAEEAEDKARRAAAAEADVEAQKVESATRARIIAKVKESPREGGLSPDEAIPEYTGTTKGLVPPEPAIPEYTGTMEGLVPPEPSQPDMGLVSAKAEAPAKPKGKRELAKEAKQAETVRKLTEMAKKIEKDSERRDVESARKYFDKLRREAGLPKTFYYDVLGRKAPEVISVTILPSAETTRRIELDAARLARARAMIAAGGGGAMLPLISGFQ